MKLVAVLGEGLAVIPPLPVQVPKQRGPAPNLHRRRRVAELRQQGLSLAQIGRRLGITKQAVHQLLNGRATL